MTALGETCLSGPLEEMWGELRGDTARAAFVTQLMALCTGVAAHDIAASTRVKTRASQARHMAMYLVHVGCEWPLQRVAQAFGRDRSTAAYAIQKVEDMRDDPAVDALLAACEACVRAAPTVNAPRAGGAV